MTLAIADEHRELATVAAAFLASVDARGETRSLLDASQAPLPSFWQKMAEAGWLGLHIAEEHGGSGFGMLELAIIVEALGRIAAPGPFLTTVIASSILALAGTEQQCGDLIPGLATGQTTAGLGLASTVTVASGTVSGDAGVVLGAPLADLLLIVVADDVLIVSTDVPGVVVSNQRNLDSSRPAARVRFDEVPLHDVTVLPGARSAAFSVARTLVAAEAAGGLRSALRWRLRTPSSASSSVESSARSEPSSITAPTCTSRQSSRPRQRGTPRVHHQIPAHSSPLPALRRPPSRFQRFTETRC